MTIWPMNCTKPSRKKAVFPCSITDQTGVGSGMRGGNGMRLKYSNPMYMDDVAVDFPDMKIILAHPVIPMAGRSPGLWQPISRMSGLTCLAGRRNTSRRFLVRYCNTLLKERVLFGSDWPMIAPEKWLAAFDGIDIKDHLREDILKNNAVRLLESVG